MNAPVVRPEHPADFAAIAALQELAFGGDLGISALVADLRAMRGWAFATQSLVAERDGTVLGHVQLSHVHIDGATRLIDAMALSPLGVHPDHQRQGVGTALVKAAIGAANTARAPVLFLEGNPKYYGPLGFTAAAEFGFRRPSTRIPQKAFQAVKLDTYRPEMSGTLVYHDVHWRHGVGLYPTETPR